MDNKKIYDNLSWGDLTESHLRPKIEKIFESIPGDIISVVDIGC